ncbi:MAG: FecR domain-containing protein [Anaerohalosphaera sp.]|nr:FecR domain-containing protein [Anaerohalosphaera sp.]
MDFENKHDGIEKLLIHLLEGDLSDEQIKRLLEWSRNDPEAVQKYSDFIKDYAIISLQIRGQVTYDYGSSADLEFDKAVWDALAETERTAPKVNVEKPIVKPVEHALMNNVKFERKISKLSIFTFLLSSAAMLFIMALVLFIPVRPIVGSLTDSIDAEWLSEENVPAIGDVLRPGKMTLVRGFAEITFEKDAKVILEAPAMIELIDTNKMFLREGKLSAHVPPQAFGFTVDTPGASIKDLGTEFGVKVNKNRKSEIHVFKGEVKLFADVANSGTATEIVTEGQARGIKNDGQGIRLIQFNKDVFTRQIPSPYELAVKQSNPVAYWRFEGDDSGKCFNSITIDNFKGQLFGNITKSDGPDLGDMKANLALKLQDMQSSVRIDNTNRSRFRNRGYTMAAWVMLDGTSSESNIISSTPNDVRSDFLARHIHVDANGNARHRPESEIIIGQTTIQPGNWYHIVVSSTPDGRRNLFVNGIIDCPTRVFGEIGKYAVDLAETITFGATNRGQQKLDGFVGALDEVVIWDRVLNANEVNSLFNSTKKY